MIVLKPDGGRGALYAGFAKSEHRRPSFSLRCFDMNKQGFPNKPLINPFNPLGIANELFSRTPVNRSVPNNDQVFELRNIVDSTQLKILNRRYSR